MPLLRHGQLHQHPAECHESTEPNLKGVKRRRTTHARLPRPRLHQSVEEPTLAGPVIRTHRRVLPFSVAGRYWCGCKDAVTGGCVWRLRGCACWATGRGV
jgi:hypothetical protein